VSLKGTQTERNLLLAYHGESNNRNLYSFFAERAKEEGYEQIAAVFLETADHEHRHAQRELGFIQTSDVEIPAMIFPVKGVYDTAANLEIARAGEHYEQTIMYPDFATIADKEGFQDIAEMLRHIATVEARHEERFEALLQNMKRGNVFRKERVVKWKCRVCGYVKEDREAPGTCPVCGFGQAYFELWADNY